MDVFYFILNGYVQGKGKLYIKRTKVVWERVKLIDTTFNKVFKQLEEGGVNRPVFLAQMIVIVLLIK